MFVGFLAHSFATIANFQWFSMLPSPLNRMVEGNHWDQWFSNGFGVRQPLETMVFDGCAPLVRWWNGYVPSSKFTPGCANRAYNYVLYMWEVFQGHLVQILDPSRSWTIHTIFMITVSAWCRKWPLDGDAFEIHNTNKLPPLSFAAPVKYFLLFLFLFFTIELLLVQKNY